MFKFFAAKIVNFSFAALCISDFFSKDEVKTNPSN